MANAQLEHIPDMGEDAMKDGFLSRKFGNRIIRRVRRIFRAVHLPPWMEGAAKFVEDEDSVELDLSRTTLKGGAAGAPVEPTNPKILDWDDTTNSAFTDSWTYGLEPEYDGVFWSGPRIIEADTSPDQTVDTPGGPIDLQRKIATLYSRQMRFDANGKLYSITNETWETFIVYWA